MTIPNWAVGSPNATLEFHLRLAALHHNREGSLSQLADELGVTQQSFRDAIARGYLSPTMAIALEAVVGVQIVTRAQLCPMKFS